MNVNKTTTAHFWCIKVPSVANEKSDMRVSVKWEMNEKWNDERGMRNGKRETRNTNEGERGTENEKRGTRSDERRARNRTHKFWPTRNKTDNFWRMELGKVPLYILLGHLSVYRPYWVQVKEIELSNGHFVGALWVTLSCGPHCLLWVIENRLTTVSDRTIASFLN